MFIFSIVILGGKYNKFRLMKLVLPGVSEWEDIFQVVGREVDLKNWAGGVILHLQVSGLTYE
jgi:hypothetical protein